MVVGFTRLLVSVCHRLLPRAYWELALFVSLDLVFPLGPRWLFILAMFFFVCGCPLCCALDSLCDSDELIFKSHSMTSGLHTGQPTTPSDP